MKIKKIPAIASALLKAKFLKKRTPLIVGWAVTDRCNRRCLYCDRRRGKYDELPTEDIFRIVDQLKSLGTIRVSLTGGEPLMRDDIGRIVNYIHKKGIETKLNSNGSLVKERIRDLRNLDILTLSLDGDRKAHDSIRGEGSYDEVMEAARYAVGNGVKLSFATVLTSLNLRSVDYITEKAGEFGAKVVFQPATELILGGKSRNPIVPTKGAYRGAIDRLIDKKRKGDRSIADSAATLKHLRRWPDPYKIGCASGWISCRIEPNGDIMYCGREGVLKARKNCARDGFKEAFETLKGVSCSDCWCAGRVELNLCFSLNPGAVLNQLRG